MKKLGLMMVCAVCALAFAVQSASAIPPFGKAFTAKYVDGNDNAEFAATVKAAKCNVCHKGKKKKDRNAYGMELAKLLDKKADSKDKEKINEALDTVAAMKAPDSDMTFGELIKAGKLPGGPVE